MLLPCRPDNGYSSRLAGAVYEVSCETNQFRATASVKKHLSEFNTQTAKDEFNNNEMILKTMFGEIKDFKEQEVSDNEREYVLTLKTGAEIRERIFINEYGVYDGFIGTKGPSNISDFNSVADKFLSSIEPN